MSCLEPPLSPESWVALNESNIQSGAGLVPGIKERHVDRDLLIKNAVSPFLSVSDKVSFVPGSKG